MGWWVQNQKGDVWGDGPADIMDEAVAKVFVRLAKALAKTPQRSAGEELGMWLEPVFNARLKQEVPPVWMTKIMNRAEKAIRKEFKEEWERPPKRRELLAGLRLAVETLQFMEADGISPRTLT